ncbi:MAG: tyrosine-protein phosphatase [Herpetosiphonaceae bacterium]|nr:tyrosine-protein phosphatase [Herpetosiphonaceae bacterium]
MSTELQAKQRLSWDACYNVRDVGGYATADGGTTRWQALVRADNLYRLTRAGQDALRAYGIKTIIDLRHAQELALDPSPFRGHVTETHGLNYVHAPLPAGADRAMITAVDAARSLEVMNLRMLDGFRPGIAAIMATLANAPAGGVLIHCHIGKDRTGLITALSLAVAGVPHELIVADYALSQEYLRPLFDQELNAEPDVERRAESAIWLSSAPETMQAILKHLDHEYGGAEQYLLRAGVTPADIERIRQRLRT